MKKSFEVKVRVWDDYIVLVEAENESDAINFVEENIDDVESMGFNSDGGRDIDDDVLLVDENDDDYIE